MSILLDSHRSFCTTGNAYVLSLLDVGKPELFLAQPAGIGLRTVMVHASRSAPYVPVHWPVIEGDVLEVERLGSQRIRVTILAGKESIDAAQWIKGQWGVSPVGES